MFLLKFAANRTPRLGWIIPVICGCPIRFLGVPLKLASVVAGYFCDYRIVFLSEVMLGISIFLFIYSLNKII